MLHHELAGRVVAHDLANPQPQEEAGQPIGQLLRVAIIDEIGGAGRLLSLYASEPGRLSFDGGEDSSD